MFRQRLSLTPGFVLSVPDLSQVDPSLVGPITDLLTFYVDWQVASGQKRLTKPGDHARIGLHLAPSWADGKRIVLGEDSFDFDISLKDLDAKDQIAILFVRHIPAARSLIKIPAEWMRAPVADTPNNWVQVEKKPGGTYSAMVGKETFDVELRIDLRTGKIISGTEVLPIVQARRRRN